MRELLKRVAERYHVACKHPLQHKALIGGHLMIVGSFALGLLGLEIAANAAGMTGAFMMVIHSWTREI
jgi:hypothetical protein